MSSPTRLRRRLTVALSMLFAGLFVSTLAAVPAQAAYGPPQTVWIQLPRQVGLATGTIQFDNGTSTFRLDLTLCRQNSYSPEVLVITAHGNAGNLQQSPDGSSSSARPPACPTNSVSELHQEFSYPGILRGVTLRLTGVKFGFPDPTEFITEERTYSSGVAT
jgi:hypothetical protein